MVDRPNGILTKTDREYLHSNGDYYDEETARQTRYQRRRDIHRRITQSLLDFQDIHTSLDSELRWQIFNEPEKGGAESTEELDNTVRSLFYWLYRGYQESELEFDRSLEEAVRQAAEDESREKTGAIVDVEVDLDVDVTRRYKDLEDLSQRLMNGDPVLTSEIYQIPKIDKFPIDVEEVDVVRIETSSSHLHIDSETAVVETILREHLGIEADIEVIGPTYLSDVVNQYTDGQTTAAVPTEEYEE